MEQHPADRYARQARPPLLADLMGLGAGPPGGQDSDGQGGADETLHAADTRGADTPGADTPGAGGADVIPDGQANEDQPSDVGPPSAPPGQVAPWLTVKGYRLVREISRGGQAVVFEGAQESTGRRVAVKVLKDGPLASPQERARLGREVQILAALDHPDIVQVLDCGTTTSGAVYLVMEYVSGRPLDQFVDLYRGRHARAGGGTPELLRLFMRICDAVNAAHLRGVVHRDLKPGNILVDDEGNPHVLDFGLARTALTTVTDESVPRAVTLSGQFLGSLPWASPEQADGLTSMVDPRSDVYSLGVILYHMLTGKFPYEVAGTMGDVLNNILTKPPARPSLALAAGGPGAARRARLRRGDAATVNAVIEAIVLKALSKRREDRYQSAGDVARDVASYLSGRPTTAAGAPPARRWRGVAGVAALAVVCASAGVVALALRGRAGGPTPDRPSGAPATDPTTAPVAAAAPVASTAPVPSVAAPPSPGLTTRPVLAWESHFDSDVASVNFSPDGQQLLVRAGTAARTYDVRSGSPRRDWPDARDVSWGPGGRVFDRNASDSIRYTPGGPPLLDASLIFSPDGRRALVRAANRTTATVFEAGSAEPLFDLQGHESRISQAAFSPDGRRVATGGLGERRVYLWDATSGRLLWKSAPQGAFARGLRFSPDGTQLLCWPDHADTHAYLYDADTGSVVRSTEVGGEVRDGWFGPRGARVVTSQEPGAFEVWDASRGQRLARLEGHRGQAWLAAFSPDGARVLTGGRLDYAVRLWDVADGHELARFDGHTKAVTCVDFSPDGRLAASGGGDGAVRMWWLPR